MIWWGGGWSWFWKKATYNNKINITLCTYSISLFSIHCSRKYHHSLTVGLLVTEELLTFRGPFLPFLPPCDIIRLFKMIVCIKYQTCWKYSKYSCHIVTSYMCSRWTINSHYVLLCNISLMSGSSWATSYIMSNCRHRKKRKQLSLWSWLRLNSRDDTEKQSTLFPVVDTKNRLWLKMGTLDFSLQANCETLLASLDVHISKSEKHLVFSFLKKEMRRTMVKGFVKPDD